MPNKILENVQILLNKYGKKLDTEKKLVVAYWKIIDKIDMKDGKISVDDFLNRATDPVAIIDAMYMIQAIEISDEEGWND
jgi:rRNA processing protein Krr1/Pno1